MNKFYRLPISYSKQLWLSLTILFCLGSFVLSSAPNSKKLVKSYKSNIVKKIAQDNNPFNFSTSSLKNVTLTNPTSLQFGPDDRLYVSELAGLIKVIKVQRIGNSDYTATETETIDLINKIPNHNDDGALAPNITTRQITGILVAGSPANPVIYVSSSDSRMGGPDGDLNLDTNSGIVSRITWNGSAWVKVDIIRGLPRSEENHANNGMQLDTKTNTLYLAVGGLTNAGSPSINFAYLTEFALSAAILSINLNAIEAMPVLGAGNTAYIYDIPTLDDPTRQNKEDGRDINDPFGGNDGLNQAKLVPGGPIQIYASGFRNVYDLVLTKSRQLYTVDNGANQGWGGYPDNEGSDGTVTNKYVAGEPGSTGPGVNDPQINNLDNLHYVGAIDNYVTGSHYGGHPNPIRANPAGAGLYTHNGTSGVWRNSKTGENPLPLDWPPVPIEMANKIEGDFQNPGETDVALLTFKPSTNGITEYTASNFNNALKGNLLAAAWDGSIFRIRLNAAGTDVINKRSSINKLNEDAPFASGFGSLPLDVVAQGDGDVFPGTVWASTYGSGGITIFEPQDFVECTGIYGNLDEDKDGFTNADEIDNNTNPCSASSRPTDYDEDLISDLNDPDDDNDGLNDNIDLFALDNQNGLGTTLPLKYELFNNNPGTGLFGVGFTGLMSNQKADNNYNNIFNKENLIAGGAVGAFTVVEVGSGDALGTLNDQHNGFQFGVNVTNTSGAITVKTRMLGSFFNNIVPQNNQSQGLYIGTGDQDNYLKITLNANGGKGGIEVVYENNGEPVSIQYDLVNGIPTSTVDFYLSIDPAKGTVQPKYAADGSQVLNLGNPISVSGSLLSVIQTEQALAVGIISTSRGSIPFTATWDFIHVSRDPVVAEGNWNTLQPSNGTALARHENAYVQAGDKFYLIGGRGIKPVQEYDPKTGSWVNKANTPIEMHHFQAVVIDGLIYMIGGFTGEFPYEKPVQKVYIYDPVTDTWMTGPDIPVSRLRGSAGVAVYQSKIYVVGGITNGHSDGHVTWFDVYDPATNTWSKLQDAPRARDHFHASVINNKLYLAGGRRSSYSTGQTFELTVPEVDVYDFISGTWTTLAVTANLPTPRAGTATAVLGDELIIIGGESGSLETAHPETEALDTKTNSWRKLANLQQSRHGSQAIVSNGGIYLAAGSSSRGNAVELISQEAFYFFEPTIPTGNKIIKSSLTALSGLTFESTSVNTSSSKFIKFSNSNGNQAILVTAFTLTGADAFSVKSSKVIPFIVPAGGAVDLEVIYKPVAAGTHAGQVKVVHSGSEGNTTITLNGTAVKPTEAVVVHRINSGGGQVSASSGVFSADGSFFPKPGNTYLSANEIAGTTDDVLYQTERYGTSGVFSYALPVTSGDYKVVLHFAELYWGVANQRLFDVSMEGIKVLDNYDIIKKAGSAFKAITETFNVSVTDGTLNVHFSSLTSDGGKDQPKVSAIEVISLTQGSVQNQVPIANAGPDKTIALPTYSVQLNGSGSDLDGTIASYIWAQVSGPNTASFSSKSVASPTVGALVEGSYVFSLTVTDDKGATSQPDQVFVIVEQQNINAPVVVKRINAGGEQLTNSIGNFTADTNFEPTPGFKYSKIIEIGGTTDDAMYQTERSSTADNGTFSYNIPVSNGDYQVVLHFAELYWWASGQRQFDVTAEGVKVLDNYDIFKMAGGSAKAIKETFNVSVKDGQLNLYFSAATADGGINRPKISAIEIIGKTSQTPVNNPPIAHAGPDLTVTSNSDGVASVKMDGSKSTDTDGQITAYNWTEAGIQLATGISPTLVLKEGQHTILLTVTDDKGATASDEVIITVFPAGVNQTPIANAGPDKTLTLPTNSTSLNGSGTDSDGSIISYNWVQVSGPNTASFSNKSAPSPIVSGLIEGSYVFSLTVTDDKGAKSQPDQVSVIVKQQVVTEPMNAIRINAGGPDVTLSNGLKFMADKYFTGKFTYQNQNISDIAGTTDDVLYKSERSSDTDKGNFAYNIPVANGTYKVKLHFAEIYWGEGGKGYRVFSVNLEGGTVELPNYDIVASVGPLKADIKEYTVSVTDEVLHINFSATADRPKISAIEVIQQSTSTTQTLVAGDINSRIIPQLQVYPNPNRGDKVTLQLREFGSNELLNVEIYDMLGRVVQTASVATDLNGSVYQVLEFSQNLNKGVYLIVVRTLAGRVQQRLVIQ